MDGQPSTPASEELFSPGSDTLKMDRGLGVVPALVWAFRVHDDGTIIVLPIDRPIERHHDSWLWLHFNLADARAANWLRKVDLPEAGKALLLSRDRHQQIHSTDECVYGVFSDLVRSIGRSTEEIAHLRFIMTEHFLVSGRHQPLSSVEATRESLERRASRVPHVASLLELIVDHVADAIDRFADELTSELDEIEDGLVSKPHEGDRKNLGRLRLTCVQLHRQLSGLRTLFHRLERDGMEGLKPALRISAGKLAQRLDALDHTVVEMRDRARVLQEEISFAMGEETNRHLHVLSILTTLFLPPTLVTGIFGMNTKGLPLTDVESGFLWAMGLLVGSCGAVYLFLRRSGIM